MKRNSFPTFNLGLATKMFAMLPTTQAFNSIAVSNLERWKCLMRILQVHLMSSVPVVVGLASTHGKTKCGMMRDLQAQEIIMISHSAVKYFIKREQQT